MEEKLCHQIREFKYGKRIALEKILIQLMPLIKSYTRKSFFMEYDDAFQEFVITIIEAISKIQIYENDAQCLTYLHTCVKNRYCFLCKKFYATRKHEELYESIPCQEPVDYYDDIIFLMDMNRYISQIKCTTHKNIAIMALVEEKSDREIAETLHLSRQYVNRIRRKLLNEIQAKYRP